jgi:hypothetical protein
VAPVKRLRPRLTYANVVSTLALFLVLGGGAAFAAKKLTTNDIKKGAIKTKLLAKNAVTNAKLAKNAVKERNIAANAVTGAKVKDGSLTPADLTGGAKVVGSATGGPLDVSTGPVPVPLSGATWTQGATENDILVGRMETTIQNGIASSCFLNVTFEIGGVAVGGMSVFGSSEPKTVVNEANLGARLASGSARSNELKANATAVGIINPCAKARIESLKVTVLGVG